MTTTATRVLAGLFGTVGAAKLAGPDFVANQFSHWGYPPSFMYAVGAAELIGAAAMLSPRTRRPAALGMCALMAGAVATHLRHGERLMALPAAASLIGCARVALSGGASRRPAPAV